VDGTAAQAPNQGAPAQGAPANGTRANTASTNGTAAHGTRAAGAPIAVAIDLPIAKGMIASRPNLTQEHFSRILHEVSAAGLIEVQGPRILVPDLERLRAHATSAGRAARGRFCRSQRMALSDSDHEITGVALTPRLPEAETSSSSLPPDSVTKGRCAIVSEIHQPTHFRPFHSKECEPA